MLRRTDSKSKQKPLPSGVGTKRRVAEKARAVLDRPPPPQGWRTTDDDEIALRRWRGRTEIVAIEALEPGQPFFGAFRVQSGSGGFYDVEIRDLDGFSNSCGCIDHRANGLGTCKHIEGVLAALRQRNAKVFREAAAQGSPRIEVFLDRRGAATPALMWPAGGCRRASAASAWLAAFIEPDGALAGDPNKVEALVFAWGVAPADIRRRIRVSRHFTPWLDRLRRERSREEARAAFHAEVAAGAASFDLLRLPLLPYQRDGVLHLAFGERALLADDMGLGKTIQAIAACELLARRKGIERVLVVCPASLKTEWEEQIARFSDRVDSSRCSARGRQRLAAYREPAFFTIVNYEQVLGDADDINAISASPTSSCSTRRSASRTGRPRPRAGSRSLRAPHAFVLTGTPIENRIDELYSIVQYLDPELLGPLFRFNRDFYRARRARPPDRLQEPRRIARARAAGDAAPPQAGRRDGTAGPHRQDIFRRRWPRSRSSATRIIAPLRPAHRAGAAAAVDARRSSSGCSNLLACMRMICDTPAILDPTCRVSPKLEELEGILDRPARGAGPQDHRVLRMGAHVDDGARARRRDGRRGGLAYRVGAAERRRAEINRFKHDPACRLFLSTDSGSVGLNLQVASAVINVDLPWNPAKLEQRIARAWRKNQTRSVSVVNLVAEGTIEHRSCICIGQKQALADGVLDGEGDLDALKMPSGRGGVHRAHAGDDEGGGECRAAHPVAGRSLRRRVAASPWRAGAADRSPDGRRWPCPPLGRPRPRRRSARGRGETARGAP